MPIPQLRSVALASLVALLPSVSPAAVLLEEGFDYADGLLDGQNGGAGWAAAWQDVLPTHNDSGSPTFSVNGGQFTHAGATAGFETISRQHAIGPSAPSTVYVGVDWLMPTLDSDTTHNALVTLDAINLAGSGNLFFGVSNGNYRVRIGSESQVGGVAAAPNQRWVVRLDIDAAGTDSLALWIDPANEASATVASVSGELGRSTIGDYIGYALSGTDPDLVRLDNLIVATTFDEALNGSSTVPGPAAGSLGLAALAFPLLRRRRFASR